MVCTYCSSETQVTNSRLQKRSNSVWRRRKCIACGAIFSTSEHVDYEKTWVVQYPDRPLSPFLRDKLFTSIYKSVQHRPSSLNDAIGLTSTVISAVHIDVKDGSLPSQDLAKATLKVLHRFDKPASISYQAFHSDVL
jgi:transcriptional repressor NrdR